MLVLPSKSVSKPHHKSQKWPLKCTFIPLFISSGSSFFFKKKNKVNINKIPNWLDIFKKKL